MAYADIFAAANDEVFQGRCLAACWDVAADLINEDPQTANHFARKEWASKVLRDKMAITPRLLAVQVLRNPTIAANPTPAGGATDGNLEFQIITILADLIEIG